MIKFVLLLSRQGKVRLSKWYTTMTQKDRAKIIREITPMVLARPLKLCNFLDWKDNKLVYKRYASLYFVAGIEEGDNELITLEVIHHFVEVLDRYFGNVCELDLIFNFHKAYFMLDEMMLAGELQEPSKKAVTRVIEAQDQLGVMPATATMTTIRAPPAAASPAPGTTWTVIFRLHGTVTKPPLSVTVVDEQTGETSDELPISSFGSAPWPRPGNKPGTLCSGTLTIPDSITPGALMVSYSGPAPEAKKPDSNRIWVSDVKLIPGSGPDVVISGHAWVNTLNSPRRFFNGTPCLPSQTPPGLTALRQEELNVIKGVGDAKAHAMRQFSDRVIEYDLYNDLGHLPLDAKKDTFSVRPILGGGAAVEGYKYPRRLRTGRPQTSTKRETNPTSGLMWVPQDEDFDETKSADFNGDALTDLTLPLVAYQLKTAVGDLHSVNKKMGLLAGIIAIYRFLKNIVLSLQGKAQILDDQKGFQGGVWNSFDDVIAIYRKKDDPTAGNANIAAQAKVGASDDDMRAMMRDLKPETRERVLRSGGIPLADWQSKEKRIGSDFWDFLRQKINDALQWEVPLVWAGAHTPALPSDGPNPKPRPTAWQTDEEYGRQWVAGQNPVAITAPSSLPAGCTITGKLVDGMLEGSTMAHLLSKAKEAPQLFFVDYMEPYRSYAEKIDAIGGRKQHAGRLLLYKRKDGHIVPAAIELWHAVDGSADGKTAVYTRENCDPKVWLVAKAIFASLDSGIHQLVSHLLRTHVCQEPYILATDRCLSTMHPVYKLITPHFLYTLRMNANARSTLINQDPLTGILEATFTPGKYNMELSAKAYESWKFKNEGLPHDLVARGVAKAEKDGKVKLLVDDYPYAEDGLLIWTALKKWNDGYLNHYYKSNGDVTADAELQAWWTEIRTKGHPDADPAAWPDACKDGIKTVADLSDITTTMIWMGSAHHAAVNFSQYDFSGLTLNRSPLIRAAIPDEGTPEYAALTSSDEVVFEKAFLTYIADPFPATRITALMTVLSQHAPNEHFLSDDDQGLVTDDAALKLHKVFVDDMKAAEATIAQRNAGNSLARSLASAGLPYNYLVPSSPELPAGYPNITGRGIPYSISI